MSKIQEISDLIEELEHFEVGKLCDLLRDNLHPITYQQTEFGKLKQRSELILNQNKSLLSQNTCLSEKIEENENYEEKVETFINNLYYEEKITVDDIAKFNSIS